MERAAKDLKSQNRVRLLVFVGFNLVVFWGLVTVGTIDINSLVGSTSAVLLQKGALATGIIILLTLFDGLVPTQTKSILVFWRLRYPLPGCRAFSDLDPKETRINKRELKRVLGQFPTDPGDQNRLWFKLYQQYSERPSVVQAQRQYLLTREMTSLSALFLVVLPISLYIAEGAMNTVVTYGIALGAQYLITARASNNFGKEFVSNVLALVGTGKRRRKAKPKK